MTDVTQILSQIEQGDLKAAEELLTLIYDELRKLPSGDRWGKKHGLPTRSVLEFRFRKNRNSQYVERSKCTSQQAAARERVLDRSPEMRPGSRVVRRFNRRHVRVTQVISNAKVSRS